MPTIASMEPMLPDERQDLEDFATDLVSKASGPAGRLTRLLSHALLRELDVGSELWSVSRGLARRVNEYKSNLQAADEPRHGDLDGRGNLTMKGLVDFCRFFLTTSVDQVDFMGSLLEPVELLRRMEIWTEEE